MKPLVTIGITSYKRIDELKRCLKSIKTKYIDEIEVLVSEDHSPLSKEIGEMVNEVAKNSEYSIIFNTNEKNLGYDMNLGTIIKRSTGKYIFLMSDDDVIHSDFLDKLIEFLKKNNQYGILYAPFVYSWNDNKDRYHMKSFEINRGEESAAKYLYDSILFSGLIFKKECVENYDSSRFKNFNYFQVYMFLKTVYKYGGYYFAEPSVMCIMDGENAYGISESSGGNELLANRKSALSIVEFNKTLIKTIKIFDEEEGTNVFKSFEKQYSLHSYSPMSLAREEGLNIYKTYWKNLNELDIHLYPIARVYYVLLYILGKEKSDKLTGIFRRLLKHQ